MPKKDKIFFSCIGMAILFMVLIMVLDISDLRDFYESRNIIKETTRQVTASAVGVVENR